MMLCTIPPLVFAGAIMSTAITKMASRGQSAYGEAAAVVEQTIGSIRMVYLYQMKLFVKRLLRESESSYLYAFTGLPGGVFYCRKTICEQI